ncbi:MAG: hypothetical protein KatS3mg110_4389 [Pirellulaceae bacterium]|nr:MAG: hypothetical protein KatS3mg110_4389 [Pirellulaceae bacterium]
MSQSATVPPPSPVAFGHPAGLFTLFFAEMWERFSFYGMRALLLLYMMKGFLKYPDSEAYTVYGAYTALVYMTPFFGGMLADRVLGARRAVVLGAILMSAGHLLMTLQYSWAFFGALALLIAGNGFFKPNISTIVGALYPPQSVRRDAGFTIFYMGINLGAGLAPLLCGYLGETYGWHYGFGLATIGMLAGLVVFINWIPPAGVGDPPSLSSTPGTAPTERDSEADRELQRRIQEQLPSYAVVAQPREVDIAARRRLQSFVSIAIICAGALAAAGALLCYHANYPGWWVVNGTIALFLVLSAAASSYAQTKILRDGRRPFRLVPGELAVYAGTLVALPILTLLVSGFAPLTENHRSVSLVKEEALERLGREKKIRDTLLSWRRLAAKESPRLAEMIESTTKKWQEKKALTDLQSETLLQVVHHVQEGRWNEARASLGQLADEFRNPLKAILYVVIHETSKPAGLVLFVAGILAFGYLGLVTFKLERVARHRMYVVFILTFFSMLFWSFFEQAGSSVNNFTDRNIDRVFESRRITSEEIGSEIDIVPTQEQLGYRNGDTVFTLDQLTKFRDELAKLPPQEREKFTIRWKIASDNVGMGVARQSEEIPTSQFQAVNPICILLFGLVFSGLWAALSKVGAEPSTPMKFALGLLQLGLGFLVFWYGAIHHDERGMVAMRWLLLGYLLHTTGELCLSPVGLSMVTRLAPSVLVSTVMGAWFLATAFSQFLAAIIAQFTNVTEGMEGQVPLPIDTVDIYGEVFKTVGLAAVVSSVICMLLVPLLKAWMGSEPAEGKE